MENIANIPTQNMRYAGFWIRLLAFLIDSIALSVASSLIFGDKVASIQDGAYTVSFNGPYILIPIAYTIGFWMWKSATPGKMLLKLKIVQENSEQLDLKTAIIRYFSYIISAIVIFLGYIWIGFDAKKQGWHDKIAKTYVVHLNK